MKRVRRHRTLTESSPQDRYGWIRLVTTPELRNRVVETARQRGVTLSDIVRTALTAYLDGKGTVTGWSEDDLRTAIQQTAPRWLAKPLELEGVMLVFGMTPDMVDDLIVELYRQERRRTGRPGR